jgi:hypothetical protein
MSASEQRNTENIARGVAQVFKMSAAVSIALVSCLLIVAFQSGQIPIQVILPLMCGFAITVFARGLFRILRVRFSGIVTSVLVISSFIAVTYATWHYASGTIIDPRFQPPYITFVFFLLLNGYWLADYVLENDPEARPFNKLRAVYFSLISRVGSAISAGEAVAFSIAILLSFAVNVPSARLEAQCILSGSSVIVTASLLWFAQFASAARPASDKPQQP